MITKWKNWGLAEIWWLMLPKRHWECLHRGEIAVLSCEMQLYKRLCPSDRGSVRQAFLKNREFKEIHGNSSKFNKIRQNSWLFATIGRVPALFYILRCFKICINDLDCKIFRCVHFFYIGSIRPSIRQSVRPSVRLSVGPSVSPLITRFSNRGIGVDIA